MRVEFYVGNNGDSSTKLIWTCRNWPMATPKPGWKVVLGLESTDGKDTEEKLATLEVRNVSRIDAEQVGVYVDMEQFGEELEKGLLRIVRWERVIRCTAKE